MRFRRFWRRPLPEVPAWEEFLPLEGLLRAQVEDVLVIHDRQVSDRAVAFGGELTMAPRRAVALLRDRLRPFGYTPFLRRDRGKTWVQALPLAQVTTEPNPLVNLLLFAATVFTTLLAGAHYLAEIPLAELARQPSRLVAGVPFSLSLLAILLAHELGHYTLGRRHGLPITLPYFIPVPPPFLVGTMGAFIKLRGPIRDRESLFDMAVAGPLAGLVLAVPLFIVGLRLSEIVPLDPSEEVSIVLGPSLASWWLVQTVLGPIPAGHGVDLHPTAVAAWFGFFVAALNLLPVGQLDGGHLAYALLGRRHRLISQIGFALVLLLGLFFWPGWIVWGVLLLAIGLQHTPTMDDITPLDPSRRLLGYFALVLLLLLLPPVPLVVR
ncbi:MAG: site-2 protease family protein [Candidatus Rokubacteria bacterium]|nr:site-2 protease family protein [Candidatus Rokubacteria bacterium]